MRRVLSGVVSALALACAGSPPQPVPVPPAPKSPADLRARAMLVLLADGRLYDPFTVASVRRDHEELAGLLALTLGRVGDVRGAAVLEELLFDPRPAVRRAAAFALGRLAEPASGKILLRAVGDTDLETAIWAVEGLAVLGVGLEEVVAAASRLEAAAQWQRLVPYLFRFPSDRSFAPARQAVELSEPGVREMATYALAREPVSAAVEALRGLLQAPEVSVRGWAARALGRIGDASDLDRLRLVLDDGEAGPRIQALRAARQLIERGVAAPPPEWREALLELFADGRPGVSLTAMESASAWLLDEALGAALRARVSGDERRAAQVALLSLSEARDPQARDLVVSWASAADAESRAVAAEAAARLSDFGLLDGMMLDPSPRVRLAALAGLLAGAETGSESRARRALADSDPAVRAVAMEWLEDHPVVGADELSRAMVGARAGDVVELRLAGTRALVARGIHQPLERGLVVQNLESLARVGEYPARREAALGMERLDRPRPPVGPAKSRQSVNVYQDVVQQTEQWRFVELHTNRGRLRARLDCPATPMTCLNFLQLAGQGFYDGRIFHRVVADFVVQTGDPRDDGWGGPGYTIRDELTPRPFERGVLGMASSGPDTAGSQFFIALSRQPHLDARYTAFGTIVDGEGVLDLLVQGDRLERVAVMP